MEAGSGARGVGRAIHGSGKNVWRLRSGRPFATIPFFRRDNARDEHQRHRGVSDGVSCVQSARKVGRLQIV